MRLKFAVVSTVVLAVTALWLLVLRTRFPYLDQIPVYDADVTTSSARMWAHNWWANGPLNMWFATPYSPLSVETPTLADVTLYQSWPPGAFVPIYLLAQILNIEPNVPLINWFNVVTHGMIALAVAFTAFNIARLNTLHVAACGFIAVGVAFPVLYPHGLVFFFSQIYCVTIAILLYAAAFILLESLSYVVESPRQRNILLAIQLLVIYLAFFVDWLSYTLFASWLLIRMAGARLGFIEGFSRRQLAGLALLPASAFGIYLFWRFFTPGSIARTQGLASSLYELAWKIAYRMNLTDAHPITNFTAKFIEMHSEWYFPHVLPLIVGATLVTATLLALSLRLAIDPVERRSIFAIASMLVLVTVPFYVHMLLLYQHTVIHRWAIAKVMFAYALVPFALLPISAVVFLRLYRDPGGKFRLQTRAAMVGTLLAIGSCFCAAVSARAFVGPALIGKIDPDRYHLWNDIRRNTEYRDVVFSPVLQAAPIGVEIGVANKVVFPARNFGETEQRTGRICGTFNVVVALPPGADIGEFMSRGPTNVIETRNIRLLRFADYPGKKTGCN
ncbi:hypothetical protein KIP88_24075 [Bradyrhizobium sp. SRL28]|uniref:hypothetical protein n=1 Tax=Bradyrhizobium sp. SRL28 TaxID=2836178 RepID=UPI001BDE8983|nr:hypothetical protein [Bradyrhizobium sp. SRL28]MBT1513573.1 hypothetical protein [Bradyrhizobium sp. SRL28]